jgi:alcohol dehydrogenase class IV
LPHVIEANIGSIRRATPTNPVLGKYKTVAQILAPRSEQPTREPARALRELIADLGVPGLASWGVRQDGLSTVVERSRGGSMRFNPVELNDDELGVILEAAR